MLFTNPIWLLALAGLSIPIGIHLLSRKEGQVIKIGSLRHLQETNTQQFKGIRINEIVLLTLRCTLIILLVLLMSGLSFEKATNSESKWVLLEMGLEDIPEVHSQLEIFQNQGYELRLLADGFPVNIDSVSTSSTNLYWRLVEQLQSEKIADVIVISKNSINGFRGMRPAMPSNIRWISVPAESIDYTLKANSVGDSIVARMGHSEVGKTYFTTRIFSKNEWSQTINPVDSIQVVIVADRIHGYDKKIIEASLEAMKLSSTTKIEIINSSPEKINLNGYGDWCIWLTDIPPSDSVVSNIISLRPELNQEILFQEKTNRWIITKRLNQEIAWSESLTVKLASILLFLESDWRTASQNDRRILPDESVWSKGDSNETSNATALAQSADSYLLTFFLMMLLVERILAYHRNQ